MNFGREDYNERIKDILGVIPDDEPVFLIRAQDLHAGDTVRLWARLHTANGGDPAIALQAREHAKLMDNWKTKRDMDLCEKSSLPDPTTK